LPGSTVSLLLSFTLNQASSRTSHPIVPSRVNGKFTCLGFVRDWFWAWLFIDQVVGSMIRGMDYHQVIYRSVHVIIIYFLAKA
jgi:hypothetical protein